MTELRRLRVRFDDEYSDLEVLLDDGAKIEALADVLGSATDELSVGGRRVPGSVSLDEGGVVDGAIIDIDANTRATDSRDKEASADAVALIDQIAGMPGDGSRLIGPGPGRIGAARVAVSSKGAVTIQPGPSRPIIDNVVIDTPTPLSGHVLNLGSARYVAVPNLVGRALDGPPTVRQCARRPPVSIIRRVAPPTLPIPGSAPGSRTWQVPTTASAFLVLLGVVAHPGFLAAAATAAAAALGMLLVNQESRSREARSSRSEAERLILDFSESVQRQRQSVEAELRAANPSIPELARAARNEAPGYWNRSVGDHDFGRATIAYGDLDWKLGVDSEFQLPPELQRVVDSNRKLTSVPVVVDLTQGPLGLVGERERALSCARALVAGLAAQTPPTDLSLTLAADEGQLPDWDWLKWLAHMDSSNAVAGSADAADRLMASWRTSGSDRLHLLILDQPKWMLHDSSLLAAAACEPGRQNLVVLSETREELRDCATIIELDSDGTASVLVGDNPPIRQVTPVCASVEMVDDIARGSATTFKGPDCISDLPGSPVGVRPFQLEPSSIDAGRLTLPPPRTSAPATRWTRLR